MCAVCWSTLCLCVCGRADLKDMSLMVLRTKGPAKLPQGYKLAMHISQRDAESVRVFKAKSPEMDTDILSE